MTQNSLKRILNITLKTVNFNQEAAPGAGEGGLLNSKSEYSRCNLPRLVVEGTEGLDGIDKKEDEGEPNVHDREIEPPPVRSGTNSGLNLRENKKGAKTNRQKNGTSDIRLHFPKKQNGD